MPTITVTSSERASVLRKGNVAHVGSNSRTATAGLTTIDTYGNTFKVPDYTIKDILSAIPKHCYERSLVRSIGYVVRDIAAMIAISYVGHFVIPLVQFENEALASYTRGALWMVQSYLIGLFGFGLWVLSHECGHGAFSDYQNVNDFIGWILHSYCGVPYFSWKFSHSKHHKGTSHIRKDMAFVPPTQDEFVEARGALKVSDIVDDSPIWSLTVLFLQQLGGLQLYLTTNATGQSYPGYSSIGKSHYAPGSPIFEAHQFWYIVISDIGILGLVISLYQWYKHYGAFNMMVNWFVPWLWVNHWLVFITFMQHTDPSMPHYTDKEWTFARGAAATIDRDYGFIGQHIFHDLIETHVLHHYVSRIPFYNAREATDAIRKVMGEHYRYLGESMWKTLWINLRACQFVTDDECTGVLMFRNINGIGVKPKD